MIRHLWRVFVMATRTWLLALPDRRQGRDRRQCPDRRQGMRVGQLSVRRRSHDRRDMHSLLPSR